MLVLDNVKVIPAPTVTAVSPSSGPTGGTTSVTITGKNFTGATAVKFGSTNASSYTVNSDTQITATAPAGSVGTVDITVTTSAGTSDTSSSDQYTYAVAPTVSAVSPSSGPAAGGTSVTITGTNFTGVTAVKFGSNNASSYTVNSANQITATSPAGGAGTVDVTVTTGGGTSATSSNDQYTYIAAPTVTGISPSSGPTGGATSVTITGTNFSGVTAVKFGSNNASSYTVDSATQITATAPAGSAGAVDVTVTTGGGTSATSSNDQYTYVPVPTITGVAPYSGPVAGGTSVVLTGTNLTSATAVKFGSTNATGYTVNSSTQITTTAPAGSAGTVDITVTTPNGTSATSSNDQYTYVVGPSVASLSVSGGLTTGGTSVVITGSNLTGATAVKFGSTNAASYTVNSATQITATSPAGSMGQVDVTVTTLGGTSVTGASDRFAYYTVPSATTGSASSITTTTASLAGTVLDNWANTTITFEYGTTASYGSSINASPASLSAGTGSTAVSASLSSLTCNTSYHFRVKAVNAAGTTNGSDGTFTTVACVPGAPTIGTATAGDSQASVSFTAPSSTGGASVTGYTVVSNPGNISATGVASPIAVSGLTNGTSYTFTVYAINSTGNSPASAASNSVTPKAAQTIDFALPGTQNFGTTPTMTATASSGLAVSFTSSTTNVCTVTTGGLVSFVAAGTCTLNADQAGNTAYGAAPTVTRSFSVLAPASISSLSPSSGTAAGGTRVIITGSNFTGVTSVKFGSANATSYTVDSATQITATSPAGAVGSVHVMVTTGYGPTTTSSSDAFDYVSAPTSPTQVTAIAGNGLATVSFAVPSSNGGSPISVYTATSNPGAITGTCTGPSACAITVRGLTNGTSYTFTVTATNAVGTSSPSAASAAITPLAAAIAGAATLNYQLNSAATLDLAPYINGTAINVTIPPAHGSVSVSGTQVTYTPKTGYFGSDAFSYTAINGSLTSVAAVVSIKFVGTRPDPSKESNVASLLSNQAVTAKRFWRAQISNFQHRLESLHRPVAGEVIDEGGGDNAENERGQGFARGVLPALPGRSTFRTATQSPMSDGMVGLPTLQPEQSNLSQLQPPDRSSASTGEAFMKLVNTLQNTFGTSGISLNLASLTGTDRNGVSIDDSNLWGAGTIHIGKTKPSGGGSDAQFTTDGLSVGLDRRVTDKLTLGIGLGFGHDKTEIGSDGTENVSNATSVVAYGSYQTGPKTFVDALIGYGWLDMNSTRYVASFDDYAKASRSGTQVFASVSASYEQRTRDLLWSPYVRYDFAQDRLNGATETGADVASLYYSSQRFKTQQVAGGIRGNLRREASFGYFVPGARIEYQRRIEGASHATVAYADILDTPYELAVTNRRSGQLLMELGTNFIFLDGSSVDLGLRWTLSSGSEGSTAFMLRYSKPLGK